MRWFKHYSDNYRGRSIASFHKDFGHSGIAWYYLLTEICTEKLEGLPDGDLAKTDCRFSFSRAFVESSLRGTFTKIERWLSHGSVMGLWTYTVTKDELHVDYPILIELLSSDQIKSRSRRVTDATKARLDKELELKLDKELNKDNNKLRTVKTELDPSTQAAGAVAVVNVEKVKIKISMDKQIEVKKELISSWSETYPKDFLDLSLKEMRSWVLANPEKQPKSAWAKFMNSWFARGWERHRTTLKSNPVKITAEDLEAFLQAGA